MMKKFTDSNRSEFVRWGQVGRRPVLDHNDLQEIVEDLKEKGGRTIGIEELREILEDKTKEKNVRGGDVPLGSYDSSPRTVENYLSLLSAHPELSVTNSTVVKTQSRYIAENSVIAAISFLTVVAATHYYIGEPTQATKEKMKTATEGARMLFERTSRALGDVPLVPIKPQYIYSSDDNVEYVYVGVSGGAEKHRLVATKHVEDSGTRAKYKRDKNSNALAGMRVKQSWIFNGVGQVAPLCVSVVGLTDQELPPDTCPSGMLILKIEGLCAGGHTLVPMGNNSLPFGYQMLVRNDNDHQQDRKRYKWIQENLFLPFVASNRRQHDGWEPGTPVPVELTAVSWCDGDSAQIKTIIEDGTLAKLEQLRIISNKQHAARTGTEQAADLSKTFKMLNRLQQQTTVEDSNHLPLKKKIEREINRLAEDGILRLVQRKRLALTEILASAPETATKALTPHNIIHGFRSNGLVDKNVNEFPDWDKILSTCRTEMKRETYTTKL